MGEKNTKIIRTGEERKEFMQDVLRDLKALEIMLEKDVFEKGIKRIGVEQELNFIDKSWRPAPIAMKVMKDLDPEFFTTEFALFNLEINCPPIEFKTNCLQKLKEDLKEKLIQVKKASQKHDAQVLLAGIVPTIRRSDVEPDVLTPEQRYKALYNIHKKAKENKYEYHIKGIDELITRENIAVFGGTMTSFQVHLQIDVKEMVSKFNWTQAIAGPLLACATNSPMFLGKRLWRETRIALFQQTTDLRKPYSMKEEPARVSFGNKWLNDSVLEEFQDDIARYKAYLSTETDEDSLELLEEDKIPKLKAFQFHNGTIYKWNRICYGITEGKPHLRIENRIFPSGPSLEDEVANTALWLGVMNGMPAKYKNISKKLDFADAKDNFLKAARLGLEVQFKWVDGKIIPAQELLLEELLPIARDGLKMQKIPQKQIDHYLGIIEERIKTRRTGSQWVLDSFSKLSKNNNDDEAIVATTAAMYKKQQKDDPVHKWKLATLREAGDWKKRISRIDQIMTTDLFTVQEEDVIDLAAHIMNWKNIGHVPVENNKGDLVGIITKDALINFLVTKYDKGKEDQSIKDIMIKDLVVAEPEMMIIDAITVMLKKDLSCLPVCQDNKIIGIITEHDFITVSRKLFNELLDLQEQKNGTSKK